MQKFGKMQFTTSLLILLIQSQKALCLRSMPSPLSRRFGYSRVLLKQYQHTLRWQSSTPDNNEVNGANGDSLSPLDSIEPSPAGKEEAAAQNEEGETDLFDFFDPRVSPHMYPDGIPDAPPQELSEPAISADIMDIPKINAAASTTRKVERVGILIIDHGSRREASNEHLEKLAVAYQESNRCPPHFLVGAAHMEIARPSIEDGLNDLIAKGASRIVCHPYFLSPGKHATEDVPALIAEATLRIARPDVTIITTNSIGSNVDIMVNAIGNVVEHAVKNDLKNENDGLGFFGDVMRMMEEQQ